MNAVFSFTVDQSTSGITLLDHLPTCIPYLSLAKCQSILEGNNVKVDSISTLENMTLCEGQVIEYTVPDYEEGTVDTNWKLLWQNEEIAAVHKPSNLPVSRTTRNVYNTLVQILRRESPWEDAHLLHRLDLETSGIILIGKNKASASKYQPNLQSLMQRKIYHAIIKGKPTWTELDFGCDLNTLKDSAIRCQMHQVEKGKLSRTKFSVLSSNENFSIVECELLTGRKHQIRAHLSILGHPIVGDKIYSNQGEFYLKRLEDNVTQQDYDVLLTSHHLLHAFQIKLAPHALDLAESEPIVITDWLYSDAWTAFVEKEGLHLPK